MLVAVEFISVGDDRSVEADWEGWPWEQRSAMSAEDKAVLGHCERLCGERWMLKHEELIKVLKWDAERIPESWITQG